MAATVAKGTDDACAPGGACGCGRNVGNDLDGVEQLRTLHLIVSSPLLRPDDGFKNFDLVASYHSRHFPVGIHEGSVTDHGLLVLEGMS